MGFYEYFVFTFLREKSMLTEKHAEYLRNPSFRKYLLNKYATQKINLVKPISEALKKRVKKPQRCFEDNENYYIAMDLYTTTYYMCFRTLMMIDIDIDENMINEKICEINAIAKRRQISFRLFRSRAGLHVFVIDRTRDFKNLNDIELMIECGGDFGHIVYSYMRGWSVRLNKKETDNAVIYTEVGKPGQFTYGPIDNYLNTLVDMHLKKTQSYNNVLSQMH